MFGKCAASAALGAFLAAGAFAQTPAKIDFARDVQPLFRQNCIGCHGSAQQMNGLRLDRRSSAFKPGLRRVAPGSSANSILYHRVAGNEFGPQMPPTGALKPEQIAVVKAWIDQGAEWPDALANEVDLPPLNPKAVAMVDALRAGDRQAFLKFVAQDPKLLNARGPEGSTPFMYAALYGDAAFLEQLLKKGADPNARNDAKATALMWAATDMEKTRVLLAHGADVNAQSDDARTPLMIAAGRPGNIALVKLLLDHGAEPNPTANPPGESSPLIQAALAADPDSMQLLMSRGADLKSPGAGGVALAMALTQGCAKCVDLVLKTNPGKGDFTGALQGVATFADAGTVRMLLDRGADVNAFDPTGRTALQYAAASELLPVDVVKLLIERGADINARVKHEQSKDSGLTPLDLARWFGKTPVVDALLKAGAEGSAEGAEVPKPRPAATVQAAIARSLPLLQRADASFPAKSGCISCHENSLTAMTVGLARKNGLPVDERIAAGQVKVNAAYLEHGRESLHQGHFAGAGPFGDTFGPGVLAFVLLGLDAEHYQPDLNTDAVALYLVTHQMPDGTWIYTPADSRPPLCADYMGQTARALRALQLYAPKAIQAESAKSIQLAAAWLARTEPKSFEDRVWRVFGLAWAGTEKDAAAEASRALAGLQRPDGGWSDMPTMESNAYATGQTLVALQTAGMPVSGPVYRRGVQFLLDTQMEDGSWYVRTRALGFQPYFDNGFPYGVDQWISTAGTDWATMALTLAASAGGPTTTAEALAQVH
jgi:ankyrin repeat protein